MTRWGALVVDQLEFYWEAHFRPRLDGLTDDEYLWEPVEGAWSLRRRDDGVFVPDLPGVDTDGRPVEPDPPPVTTIAWRLTHIATGCFSTRTSTFFDDTVPDDADMFDPRHLPAEAPATADAALAFLDEEYRRWHDALAALSDDEFAAPLGPKGGPFADDSMASLGQHVNRELMHHGGEVGLLRDLYLRSGGARLA